ncbi:TonB-dependent siderophore receptor [Marinobacter sp. HL-58]|uniref:TonB-dependent receptor plug domain-containing protein n=1 Tax=Marinobacter sp. HL-58 TaxID=1479237 RepID=UPI0006DAA9B8|nr:TonB-dependent receptor [Marinobacter sp. HL-58]KPQ01611.1 MAG: TonB-dependent receptor [Marinobacter sp. HL-58]
MSVTNDPAKNPEFSGCCALPLRIIPVVLAGMLLPLATSANADDSAESYELAATGDAPEAFSMNSAIPEVLTTTRLRQPKSRVPGTTTIITGDMIRDLGIMNLVEVFRLVPGMTVDAVGSNQPVTSYHGTVHYEQRRLQVQVDGRTSYQASLSDMDWNTMPVPLDLIERIEISRGPNSAAYGINAFLGTINIITRAPEDSAGVELRAISGSRGYGRAFGSAGNTNDDYTWRVAYEKRKSDGFDEQEDDGQIYPFNNGFDINTFNYDSNLTISSDYDLDIRAGVVDGVDEEDARKNGKFGANANPDILVDDYYLQTRLNVAASNRHFFHLQASFQNYDRRQRWRVCIPQDLFNDILDPDEPTPDLRPCTPEDNDPFLADLNEDTEESRLEFELQDTILFNPDLKLVSGLGYRKDTYRSETFFNGRGNNYQSRVFGNLEYSPFRWLTLNSGANWERTTTTDEGYFSPRLAANFILSNNHTLRFVYSRAVRTPDAFEQNPNWSYRPRDVAPPYEFLEGERFLVESLVNQTTSTFGKDLEEERITSREISYFGQYYLDSSIFSMEVRYFNDQLRDMISGIINEEEWTIDNNVALDQEGFEVEASLDFPGTQLRLGYAYLDQDGRYTGANDRDAGDKRYAVELLGRLSVRHSGSFTWIQDLPFDLTSSAAFYFADEFRRAHFERADFRLARRVHATGYSYELALTMQHYLNTDPTLSPDNIIRDHNQFFVEAGVRF